MSKTNPNETNPVTDFFKELFSPISSFVYTGIGAALSTIFALKLTKNGNITHINLLYLGLLIWFFFLMATFLINYSSIKPAQYKIKSLEERLKEKDNTIKEQRLQLKDEMYMIAGKYGDFSNFIKQEKVTDFLGKIVNNFTYIEAIQVHSFNMMVDDESIVFKLIYDNSYAKEGVSINNINQQYYKVNKYIYTNFKRTIDYYKIYLDSFDKEIASSIVDHAVDILIDISDDYTSEHRRIFDILLSIIEDLNPDENIEGINDLSIQEYEQEGDDSSPEIIIENYDEIIDFKRTGILGSILMNADYMYEYEKINNSKMHRKYFSFHDEFDNENKIITLIINSNSESNIREEKIIKDVISYYEKLRKSYFE